MGLVSLGANAVALRSAHFLEFPKFLESQVESQGSPQGGANRVTRRSSWAQELSGEAALAGVKKNGQGGKVGDGQEGKVAQEEVQAGGGGGDDGI